ncbi:hypothetical protein [Minwuia sp.]|uniref:hypothetical protein n=1 Tax=Minwuia sp. TaxID=2493630 RepID=UPI003A906ECA
MKNKIMTEGRNQAEAPHLQPPGASCALSDDEIREFAAYFDDEDVTDEQVVEFIQIYWALALEVMAMDFGLHPVQLAEISCGKLAENDPRSARPSLDSVYSKEGIIAQNFEEAAKRSSGKAVEDLPHE